MGSSKYIGDCRLCSARDVRLNDSHILPKWSYRLAGDPARTLGFSSPVHIDSGNSYTSSRQSKEYLLCDECEQRLGKDEGYVRALAAQEDNRLGLLDLVTPTPSQLPNYLVARLGSLELQAIARFGASVFWRASVSGLRDCRGLRLWKNQVEELRGYVLATRPWSVEMCLMLYGLVEDAGQPSNHGHTTVFPTSYRSGEHGWHQFAVCGLVFTLALGDKVGPMGAIGLTGRDPCIVLCSWKRIGFMVGATETIRAATPRGRLADIR
jgi:hypothetical protein